MDATLVPLTEERQERMLAKQREELPRRLPLVMTPLGEYEAADWDGHNTSGFQPTGDCVLIRPDQPAEKTSKGVYLLPDLVERYAAAAETGVIVAIGDGAWFWNQDRTRRYTGYAYAVGDRVTFTRYAGQLHCGIDGWTYRIVSDREIGGRSIPLPDTHEFYYEEIFDPDGQVIGNKRRVRMKSIEHSPTPAIEGPATIDELEKILNSEPDAAVRITAEGKVVPAEGNADAA